MAHDHFANVSYIDYRRTDTVAISMTGYFSSTDHQRNGLSLLHIGGGISTQSSTSHRPSNLICKFRPIGTPQTTIFERFRLDSQSLPDSYGANLAHRASLKSHHISAICRPSTPTTVQSLISRKPLMSTIITAQAWEAPAID